MARLRALALLWLMGGCTGLLREADSGVPGRSCSRWHRACASYVERVAGRHRHAGHDVRVVDMHAALTHPADFADGPHPSDQGYAKMAQVWLEALLAP